MFEIASERPDTFTHFDILPTLTTPQDLTKEKHRVQSYMDLFILYSMYNFPFSSLSHSQSSNFAIADQNFG